MRNLRKLLALTAGFLLILNVLSLTGCRSAGYMKSDAAAGRIQRAAQEEREEAAQLDATISNLNDLLTNPAGDLRVQFDRFTDALHRLEKLNRYGVAQTSALRKRGEAYFKQWDKELTRVNDEQIHHNSWNRKTEAVKQFDTAMQSYADAQNGVLPVIDYLRDIRTALSTDLTMGGLQAVKEPAKKAADQAAKARDRLAHSADAFDTLGDKLSFFAPEKTK